MTGAPTKRRRVSVGLAEDEAKALHVLLAALALGEAAVRDAALRHELALGRAKAALAAAIVAGWGGASFETAASRPPQDEEGVTAALRPPQDEDRGGVGRTVGDSQDDVLRDGRGARPPQDEEGRGSGGGGVGVAAMFRAMAAMARIAARRPAQGFEVCLGCGAAVDVATPVVAVWTGTGRAGAVLHAACHPAWWLAPCATARDLAAGS